MTKTIRSVSASSAPTKSYEQTVGDYEAADKATSTPRCPVFDFQVYAASPPPPPANHGTVRELIDEWEQDAEGRAAMEDARRWVRDTFYAEDGDTVRTLRLKKGWSQARLAEAIKSSQSHVARIERGTQNVTIETCRKLAAALEIDMNELDQALNRQEAITQANQK